MICESFSTPFLFFFSDQVPQLLYYSHITALVTSLLIGILVYLKDRTLKSKILLTLTSIFFIYILINLTVWTNNNSDIIIFVWSFFGLLYTLMALISFYFFYSFVYEKDLPFKAKVVFFILLLVPIFITPTKFNLNEFDLSVCGIYNGGVLPYFFNTLGILVMLSVLFVGIKRYLSIKESMLKKKVIYMSIGLFCFLSLFFLTSFISDYLVSIGIIDNFSLEFYGLFGMVIFMAFLAFLIVRFKAFNIKMLGAQALVWALVILIGSEFLFVENTTNQVLVAVTLVISGAIGLNLIRSVKQIDQQKDQLELANKEQENLIHFISHQVKGFFTKSRNIFATMDDEKATLPADILPLIHEGLRSDNEGISVVSNILNAANLKTGKIQYLHENFHLNHLMDKIVADCKSNAEVKGLKLNYTTDGTDIEFNGDETRLKDAIYNIVQNAVNYTMAGEVNVKLDNQTANKVVKIIVKDTGVGLTEDDKTKLFRSGGRGSESLKYNVNSTGYGLYIAKKVIEGHGGTITAESAGRDKGSTFTIILPVK